MSSFIEEFCASSTPPCGTDLEITSKPMICCGKSKRCVIHRSFNKTQKCTSCKIEKDEADFQKSLYGDCKQIFRQCTAKNCTEGVRRTVKFGGDKMIEFERR